MIYQLFISIYQLLFKIASLCSTKANDRIQGIKSNYFPPKKKRRIWLHCASAGEYEQCIPLIQKIKKHTSAEVCISFFSPSGVEYYQLRPHADFYFYLPFDTLSNARELIESLQPDYVIWVKYDFWENIIQELYLQNIPCDLIFTDLQHIANKPIWMKDRIFNLIPKFNHVYSITPIESPTLAHRIIHDGKWEQALLNTYQDFTDQVVEHFIQNSKVILIGSAHTKDIQLLVALLKNNKFQDIKWIVVPHQIDRVVIEKYQEKLHHADIYSEYNFAENNILIVNQMGSLKYLYRFADIAWIGGGLDKSIHNALEASAYKIPLVSGPKIQGMPEAKVLQDKNILHTFKNSNELEELLSTLLKQDKSALQKNIERLYLQKSEDNYSSLILSDIQRQLLTAD